MRAIALDICRDLKVPVLPRGGGTSQCGQTVGAGAGDRLLQAPAQRAGGRTPPTAPWVEPGIVLDHLNAQLKKHGLWYPVDVSTSGAGHAGRHGRQQLLRQPLHRLRQHGAQRAGRAGLDLRRQPARFGRFEEGDRHARALGERVRDLAWRCARDRGALAQGAAPRRRLQPGHLPQPEREALHRDGSVNLAHLLVGSEGTLALTRSLTLQLSELPAHKVLGVVNFPTFYKAMDSAQHIVKLGDGTLTAVELVDRTMIELSLQNPAFAATVRTALIGQPDADAAGGVRRRRQDGAAAQAEGPGAAS